jgi:cation transport ATPase
LKKIIRFLTAEGATTETYQRNADRFCFWTSRIGIAAIVIGILCIWFFVTCPYAALIEAIEGILNKAK